MTVIEEIAAERRRQIEVEGFDAEHDDQHTDGSLATAAAAFAIGAADERAQIDIRVGRKNEFFNAGWCSLWRIVWPKSWGVHWFKQKDPRRDLIRAAALIVAEIERLDRAAGGPS